MRKIFAILFTFEILFGSSLTTNALIKAYKKGHYRYVCLQGYKLFDTIRKDENLLNMYAFSCLRSDYIDRLAVPIIILGKTASSRKNRAYFSLILAQKNILVHALLDGESFTGLNVPDTDFYLSKVFNAFFQKKFTFIDNRYIMHIDNTTYILYKAKDRRGHPVMVIEEKINNSVKRHIFR